MYDTHSIVPYTQEAIPHWLCTPDSPVLPNEKAPRVRSSVALHLPLSSLVLFYLMLGAIFRQVPRDFRE